MTDDDRRSLRLSGEFYPSMHDYVTATVAHRVLLVQADEQLRHLFATGLRKADYAVLATPDGDEAVRVLASISRGELPKPHAVVIDLQLPAESGTQLLTELQRAAWRVPVIVLAANLDEGMRTTLDRFGVSACITKPVSTALLARAVATAIAASVDDGRQ